MGFADEVEAERAGPSRRAKIDLILEDMSEADAGDLQAALENKGVASSAIGRALRKRGHEVSDAAIVHYRANRALVR